MHFTKLGKMLLINKKAVINQLKGNQKYALQNFDEIEGISSNLGDILTSAKIAFNKAGSYFLVDDYELSLQSYQKAEESYKILDDNVGIGKCYNGLSAVYSALGEYSIAERYITLTEQIFKNSTNKMMYQGVLYKHASISFMKGDYEECLRITNMFANAEKSILHFEAKFLELTAIFEQQRLFDKISFEELLELAESLDYKIGKANLLLESAKVLALSGNIKFSQTKLDLSYSCFQQIGNYRGIIRSLLVNAYIEVLQGKLEEAENYCDTALTQAKNSNLFLEEIEASILLANIYLLQNFIKRANYLLEKAIYSLEVRKLRNSLYLRALSFKCTLIKPTASILNQDLINFIKLSKNSGCKYWIDYSRILEAEEYVNSYNYTTALLIVKDVIATALNYEIKFQAKRIELKGLLGILRNYLKDENNPNETIQLENEIEVKIQLVLTDVLASDLQQHIIETKLVELSYLLLMGKNKEVNVKTDELNKLITKNNLNYYLLELKKLGENTIEGPLSVIVNSLIYV